jgi:hypothetical protein
MKKIQVLLILIFNTLIISAQKDNWDVYLAQYEKGPGSVVLDMDIIHLAPFKDLPYILITGVSIKKCNKDGFPEQNEFQKLYQISDSINRVVNHLVKTKFVGTFTYQCERNDYIYVNDTVGLRNKLEEAYRKYFPEYKPYINLRIDKNWIAYKEFLYPNETTFEYMSNQKVINQLLSAGDNLSQSRQVDHWLYFPTKNDRDSFSIYAEKQFFKIEDKNYLKDEKMPFQLKISRKDKVDIESISTITLQLRKEATKDHGDYDGWETMVIK